MADSAEDEIGFIGDYDDSNIVREDGLIEVPDELLEGLGGLPGEEDDERTGDELAAGVDDAEEDDDTLLSDEALEKETAEDRRRKAQGLPPVSKAEKRARRLKYLRHEAERRAADEATRAEKAEAELAAIRQHFAEQKARETLDGLQDRRKALLQQIRDLRDSFEDSDEAKADALELELRELDAEAVAYKRGRPMAPPVDAGGQAQTQPQPPPPPAVSKADALANEWLAQNRQAYQNPAIQDFVAKTLRALTETEGMSLEHPRTYEELTKRMRASKAYASAAGGPARGNEGGHDSGGKASGFSDEDARAMRLSGMNPRDPKQRAKYLDNIREFG